MLEFWATNDGERKYLSLPENNLDLTYGLFYQQAEKFALHLKKQGLEGGQRVAVSLENGLNWLIVFWGVLLADGVIVPLNPNFTPAETSVILNQAGVQYVIADNEGVKALPPELSVATDRFYRTTAVASGKVLVLALSFLPCAASDTTGENPSDREAVLLFTSGTTGVPKGVVLTHGNLLAEANFILQGHQLTHEDIVLCVLPFFHVNGLVITLITPVLSGGRAIVPRKFSATHFWEWVRQYRVTWFSAVPTILSILLSQQKSSDERVSSLRFARSASASLPVAILESFEERFGVPVIEAYGLSEAGSQVATNPLPPKVRKAGSVGLPAGNEIRVVNDGDKVVPNGEVGEVVVKGPNVTRGYLHNSEVNRESFKEGWFHTGDLGYFDHEGYLYLTGRRKELINRAGEKIAPREVDEVIYRLPEVEIAAAVGVPDKLFGEEIVAFVQLRPGTGLGEEAIIEYCRTVLAEYKVPKRIFSLNEFPKGPNGKVQRRKLVELYHELTGSRPE
ncbi:MAG TPA: AMP-binding protein [Negativicutes bacterium]|nr:AMP-binding protein [Negativicutes bacterium]